MPLQTATLECLQKTRRGPAERTLRVQRGRTDWCVRERWRNALFGPDAPDWFRLDADGRADLIKKGHHRSIWRIRLDTDTYVAKLFERHRGGNRVKDLVRGRAAEREWRALLRAEACGVPVVKPLAVGLDDADAGRAVLITQAVPHAERVTEAWTRRVLDVAGPTRRRAADDIIRLVARLFSAAHEAGFLHPDAHPQNILIGRDGGESHAVFADVHDARLRDRPLSLKQGLSHLALLDQFFQRCATRPERLRFLRVCLADCPSVGRVPPGSDKERVILAQFERITRRHAGQLARQRDRRLFQSGKYFTSARLRGGWRATLTLALERRHVFPEPDIPDRTPQDWTNILNTILENAPAPGNESPFGEGNEDTITAERFGLRVATTAYRNPLKRFLHTLLGNPQGRYFVHCHRLRHRDRPADLVLAYLEHRRWGLVDHTMLIHAARSADGPPARPREALAAAAAAGA